MFCSYTANFDDYSIKTDDMSVRSTHVSDPNNAGSKRKYNSSHIKLSNDENCGTDNIV